MYVRSTAAMHEAMTAVEGYQDNQACVRIERTCSFSCSDAFWAGT